jgi:N-methylhydantoinase A
MFDRVGGWISTPVYRRTDLGIGAELTGPAVIEELDSTVLVPPGVQLTIDHQRSIRMELQLAPSL